MLLLFIKFLYEKRIKPYQTNLNAFKFYVRHVYEIEYNILQNEDSIKNILKNGNL